MMLRWENVDGEMPSADRLWTPFLLSYNLDVGSDAVHAEMETTTDSPDAASGA